MLAASFQRTFKQYIIGVARREQPNFACHLVPEPIRRLNRLHRQSVDMPGKNLLHDLRWLLQRIFKNCQFPGDKFLCLLF